MNAKTPDKSRITSKKPCAIGSRLAAGLITMAVTVNVAGCGGIVIKGLSQNNLNNLLSWSY